LIALMSGPDMSFRPRRSVLYVPASNAKALDKVRSLPCDSIIVDLEDAVAPEAKLAARRAAVEFVVGGGGGERELIVRVNGLDTSWGEADLDAIAQAGPDAILVPKVNDGAQVRRYDAALQQAPDNTQLWAMIETAHSIFRLDDIASQAGSTRLSCWVMGTNDLAKEMRAELDAVRAPFLAALSLSVTAARAYGLDILDGVFNEIDNAAGFESQCRQGLAFGFDGKTLVHPSQIATCNRCFTPTDAQLHWSKAVVEAFGSPENQGKGALRVDGRMVERLHLDHARGVIAVRQVIDARAPG